MSNCTVYIDEAGDLGINRGTQWFVLSAVVVDKTDEASIRSRLSKIRTLLNIKEVHLNKIRSFYKRAVIVRELKDEQFTYMNILVDTCMFDKAKIPTADIAYNYICKYLLQRVSWFLEDTGRVADIILSARGTSRDNDLIAYINEKLLPYPDNNINGNVFRKISAKAAASWDLLQLADVCATTMFSAHQTNEFGFCTPCFSYALKRHLYHKQQKVLSYGIKYFNPEMKPDSAEWQSKYICNKKERIPGATTT